MQISIADIGHTYNAGRSRQIETLRDINFTVEHGARLAIVGPSGAGKTTLLRIIAGLLAPTRGQVKLDGEAPAQVWKRGGLGYVFQDPVLLPWRSVAENVRLPLEIMGKLSTADAQVESWLNAVGLSDFRDSFPDELSGGMRSRVSIARGVVTSPTLLLMDEPFNGLDELVAQTVMEEIGAILGKLHASLLFISHNIQQAVFMSDRVIVLSSRPATVLTEIDVPISWPRTAQTLADPQFAHITNEVRMTLLRASSSEGFRV